MRSGLVPSSAAVPPSDVPMIPIRSPGSVSRTNAAAASASAPAPASPRAVQPCTKLPERDGIVTSLATIGRRQTGRPTRGHGEEDTG